MIPPLHGDRPQQPALTDPPDLRRIIHLSCPPDGSDMLMEMPGSIPVRFWMGELRRALVSSGTITPQASVHLETEAGVRIEPESTLAQAGIANGAWLVLVTADPAGGENESSPVPVREDAPDPQSGSPIVPAVWMLPPLPASASLIHSSGIVFELDPVPVMIGRSGREYRPEIDLSPLDRRMIASRRHAVIARREFGYVIRPEDATNGTFVNGEEIPSGRDRILADGDCLQFGFHGVELTFRQPAV